MKVILYLNCQIVQNCVLPGMDLEKRQDLPEIDLGQDLQLQLHREIGEGHSRLTHF